MCIDLCMYVYVYIQTNRYIKYLLNTDDINYSIETLSLYIYIYLILLLIIFLIDTYFSE